MNGGSKGQTTCFLRFYTEPQSSQVYESPPLSLECLYTGASDSAGSRCTWRAPGRAGSGAGFYLDSQAALRRACFASSRVLRGSRSWRFEVWELRDRAFLGGTRVPGMHSLLRSNRAGSVCLQGAAKTHLFTQACL